MLSEKYLVQKKLQQGLQILKLYEDTLRMKLLMMNPKHFPDVQLQFYHFFFKSLNYYQVIQVINIKIL